MKIGIESEQHCLCGQIHDGSYAGGAVNVLRHEIYWLDAVSICRIGAR